MTAMQPLNHHRSAPLEEGLAHALADELVSLNRDLGRLAAELAGDATTLRRHMTSLQSIDRVTQIHHELAGILHSRESSEERLAGVRLEDLHERLHNGLAARRNGCRIAGAISSAEVPSSNVAASDSREDERYCVKADIRMKVEGDAPVLLSMCDLSRGGIGTDGLVQPPVGTHVTIEFPNGFCAAGCAVWRDGFTSGIRFDRELELVQLESLRHALLKTSQFRRKE